MSVLALFNHALNFLAPALWLALLMPVASRIFFKKRAADPTIRGQTALLFVVGVLVLLMGLVVFGHDGKMLTYLALVLVGASAQWLIQKGR